MIAWGALQTHYSGTGEKPNKTQPYKAFGNGPKERQQRKKLLFKKIYKNLMRQMSIYDTWTNSSHFQLSRVETPLQTSAAKNTGFPFPEACRKVSFPEEQYGSVFHPVYSYLFLRLSSRWVWLRGRIPTSATQLPLVEWKVYLGNGMLRRMWPWIPFPQLVRW